ncbi:ligase-associated DNA damage response DEXH box helicase [Mesohalobacter halotolerans]|uniref:Ligase-associated DNA damage response DEXH box helicase n=1 Tax=Mesohalobacter halotolerans TaxID=1883405 RepID=A0A4U5TVP0_9FLAO|nr:ligase-associated DNA damage response DEXH box helicase [Mesohalobacter halotolerans]TKS57288.1 ligase-associated DNA damage response DEXH box helicase [Mesohalobacter halotolerans]
MDLDFTDFSNWFASKNWKVFDFQNQTWQAYAKGKSGLVNAPTGSGKTYALWVPILAEISQTSKQQKGLKAIWVTPLRALALDIKASAENLISDLELDISVGIRNGDTSQKERQRQKRNMPDLLITTPESLHLLLATKNYPKLFQHCKAIVADEWHELLGTKRGVLVELALSRLKSLSPLKVWGISATIGNLDQAMQVLFGDDHEVFETEMVIADIQKEIEVKSILPQSMDKFPWRGHLGLHLLEEIVPIIKNSKSTLIFTNTRSQCEIWFQKLLEKHPEFAGDLAMHHGSIDKQTRLWVEHALRDHQLKAVVCTSSLDLGVDFAPVETIIQIGGPKGVARFMQRAGRSGHRPGKKSRIYFLPTHAIELVEALALQNAVKTKTVEERLPHINSYDVLVQYLTTLAISEGFRPQQIYEEVKSTFCFQDLDPDIWQWALDFITTGGSSLENYTDYHKVIIDEDGLYKVKNRGVAMRHRLQIGSIVSDAVLKVKYMSGRFVGSVEEWFISKLNPGDAFTFAGKTLELVRIKNMEVYVRKSKAKNAKVPSWMGGRLSLSSQMSESLRQELYQLKRETDSPEFQSLKPILEQQQMESIIPDANEFLIEIFKTRDGFHHVFYPFEGRFVHEAMASLVAYRISLQQPISFSLAFNDYGFELLTDKRIGLNVLQNPDIWQVQNVNTDLYKSLNATEMARRKFRDIAVISGLVFSGYPGKVIKSKHLQSGSQLIFEVFRDYEPDNPLFLQAYRETFEYSLEEGRLLKALERINRQQAVIKSCEQPTPFSFPIITDRLREKLSSEKLEDRIKKMIKRLQRK